MITCSEGVSCPQPGKIQDACCVSPSVRSFPKTKVRLNFQHYLWKETLGYSLHPSIQPLTQASTIADVGTGTGYVLFSVDLHAIRQVVISRNRLAYRTLQLASGSLTYHAPCPPHHDSTALTILQSNLLTQITSRPMSSSFRPTPSCLHQKSTTTVTTWFT